MKKMREKRACAQHINYIETPLSAEKIRKPVKKFLSTPKQLRTRTIASTLLTSRTRVVSPTNNGIVDHKRKADSPVVSKKPAKKVKKTKEEEVNKKNQDEEQPSTPPPHQAESLDTKKRGRPKKTKEISNTKSKKTIGKVSSSSSSSSSTAIVRIASTETSTGSSTPILNAKVSALTEKINNMLIHPLPDPAKKSKRSDELMDSAKLAKLKEQYEELKNLRITKPEEQYKQLKSTMDEHKAASQQLIAQLKADVKKLQNENDTFKKSKTDTSKKPAAENAKLQTLSRQLDGATKAVSEKDKEINGLKADIQMLQRQASGTLTKNSGVLAGNLVDFYEMFTSLRVQPLGDNKFLCTCLRTPLKFEMFINGLEIEYTPVEPNLPDMPECLRESVFFPKREVPVFLTKIITYAFGDD